MRVGMGYDVHKLVEGRDLILGGVKIPYEKGLLGHSDADVLLHAIMDALLGAAALGDIGKHFPDTDPAYKGASSIRLLEEVGRMIDEKLYVIGNIDATIIAQRPKMAPHIEQMRKNVAEALHIDVDQVNIKATTEEGLGFTGTGEGISSQAIASLDTIANYSYQVGPQTGGCAGKCHCRVVEKGVGGAADCVHPPAEQAGNFHGDMGSHKVHPQLGLAAGTLDVGRGRRQRKQILGHDHRLAAVGTDIG